ncbi:MAG: 30S ribosomal protein S24e [Candidatus Helarchaeota archaeon]
MSLKIIIEKEFDNPLLSRKQINFKILHQRMPTPTRIEVKKKLAAQYNVDLERVIISKLTPKYGQEYTVGYAKIYDSVEKAMEIEPKYIIKRNQPKEEKKKEE